MCKQIYVLCFVWLIGLSACQKDKLPEWGVTDSFNMTSAETGTNYSITAFYPDKEWPAGPVPVVYVLDGFWYKDMTAGIIHDLVENGSMPKVLMVSLDYEKGDGVYARSTDLVYPIDNSGFKTPEGDKFFRFMKDELAPRIESTYPCDTAQRTLLGHSLGGFFALYSLLDNASSPFFKKVVAASCSIGLGTDNAVFVKEQQVAQQVNDINATLYMACGELVGSTPAMHQEFYNRMKQRNYPNLNIQFETFKKSHGTDPYPSFKNGLQYVFHP